MYLTKSVLTFLAIGAGRYVAGQTTTDQAAFAQSLIQYMAENYPDLLKQLVNGTTTDDARFKKSKSMDDTAAMKDMFGLGQFEGLIHDDEHPAAIVNPIAKNITEVVFDMDGRHECGRDLTTTTTPKPSLHAFHVITTTTPAIPQVFEMFDANVNDTPTALDPIITNTTTPIPDAIEPAEFDGIVIRDGQTNFCKIFVKELENNQYQIMTPFNVFITEPFSLVPDLLEARGFPLRGRRRMFNIRMGDTLSRYLEGPGQRVGFYLPIHI